MINGRSKISARIIGWLTRAPAMYILLALSKLLQKVAMLNIENVCWDIVTLDMKGSLEAVRKRSASADNPPTMNGKTDRKIQPVRHTGKGYSGNEAETADRPGAG